MKPHQPSSRILCPEPVLHQPVPDLPRRTILRDLLKEIIMRIKEEAQPRPKLIHVQSTPPRPLDILHTVIDRKSQLLQRSRSCLANVISADRNRVKPRRELRPKLEC